LSLVLSSPSRANYFNQKVWIITTQLLAFEQGLVCGTGRSSNNCRTVNYSAARNEKNSGLLPAPGGKTGQPYLEVADNLELTPP